MRISNILMAAAHEMHCEHHMLRHDMLMSAGLT